MLSLGKMLLALGVALALPATAQAATVAKIDGTTLRYTATDGIRDIITLSVPDAATIRFDTSNGSDVVTSGVGCAVVPLGSNDVNCGRLGITRIVFELRDGQDVLSVATAFPIAITVSGGTGDDFLEGSAVGDVIRGEADGDIFVPSGGADDVGGGPGFDGASFNGLGAVTVSLDDVANDGQAGGAEGANVRSDVEDLRGTANADVLVGSARANDLDGGDGADRVDGGGGADFFNLGAGDDTALARDGIGERVVCGDGADTVTGDDTDELGECENLALSGELVRDLDKDGIAKPDDCNDGDPAVRPGAPDPPDDGVDQDCDGVDATDRDRDRDGVARPFDCDDADPLAAPGLQEVFGNRRDEDCSGRADPLQTITTPVRARFVSEAGAARISRLQVIRPEAGTTVQVRCSGRGCPFARRTVVVKRTTRALDLRDRFKLRRLGRQTLEVRLLREDSIGRIVRFVGQGGGIPVTRILCLEPGRKRPGRC